MRARNLRFRALLPLALTGALVVACGDDDNDGDDAYRDDGGLDASVPDAATGDDDAGDFDAATGDATTDDPDAGEQLTANQIVGVITAANLAEIEAGQLALTKGSNPRVVAYAQQMVTAHQAAEARVDALGITPLESDTQTTFAALVETMRANLNDAPIGTMFDQAYVNSQVEAHRLVLEMIDEVLLPSADSEALRSELTRMRGEVAAHLAEAETLDNLQADGGLQADAGTTVDASTLDAGNTD